MNYGLSELAQEIRGMVREFAETRVKPVRAELDEEGRFPAEILRELGKMDLMGLYIPAEYGGTFEGDSMPNIIAVEELSRICIGVSVSYAANGLGADPILIGGSEAQKKKYLPPLASGEKWAAYALTEPNAGSDAGSIRTTAVRKGDNYVLNGTKQWITNGGEADIYTVFAVTDRARGARGVSAFIVEKGTPGFSFGKKENKLGIRASATRELIFEDCEVPAENLIGREGTGFIWAMKTFDVSRPGIAAQAVGLAQGALDEAVAYAKVREQFGRPIIANQGLSWMLAEMATKVETARALTYAVVKTIDAGSKDYSKFSAMCKMYASDAAMQVATDAVQVFGGYGYMKEYPVEKMMRDAKILQIYEGTNQIQRDIIGLALNKEYAAAARK
ncbi:MAG: acyl-CoA dehydrogenase family protein [Kiritimatiellae bacterium]|nr:acyl-CoA dehydrogenase family protein [Kiritimatiellia bacterium]MDD3440427.1 acyl-CoA dehydrogenase family protein [Kiritimatiellia bacterium]MDD4117311.1 acyl-CoA dehydrogenase family protein [Kiritimatiellia bacterium]